MEAAYSFIIQVFSYNVTFFIKYITLPLFYHFTQLILHNMRNKNKCSLSIFLQTVCKLFTDRLRTIYRPLTDRSQAVHRPYLFFY